MFFLAIVLWCNRKVSANWKKYSVLRSPWFFKNENFAGRVTRTRAAEVIELIQIYLVGRNVSLFENRKKMLNHSTLIFSICVQISDVYSQIKELLYTVCTLFAFAKLNFALNKLLYIPLFSLIIPSFSQYA